MADVLIIQPSIPLYRRKFFELVATKFDVELICSAKSIDGVRSDTDGLTCGLEIVEAIQIGRSVVWQKRVVKRVWREPIKILVIGGNPRYVSSLVAILVAKARGIKVVWWGHAMSSTSVRWRAYLRFQFMRLADRILLYYVEEREKLPIGLRSRAIGIGNSVDTREMLRLSDSISVKDVSKLRTLHGLGDRKLIITIGRLVDKARVDLLLNCIALLKKSKEPAVLVVLGGGDAKEQLMNLASKLRVSNSVLWIGPTYDEKAIALWMRAADIFAYGGQVGLSLIHAFTYGLPAVISDDFKAHNPEVTQFRIGEHGSVFRKDDFVSLAATLEIELDNVTALRRKGLAAQQLIRNRLGIERMAERFGGVLSDLITNSNCQP